MPVQGIPSKNQQLPAGQQLESSTKGDAPEAPLSGQVKRKNEQANSSGQPLIPISFFKYGKKHTQSACPELSCRVCDLNNVKKNDYTSMVV